MPTARNGDVTETGTADSQPAMMRAVADKLRDQGIDVRLPDPGDGPCLTITNAKQARSDLTVDDSGYVTWDYWPLSEGTTDPADITAVALAVLGGSIDGPAPSTRRALTLKGAVGQALQARGMNVTMAVYTDSNAFEVAADIIADNPDLPECGQVHVTDDGYLTWQYHHHDDSPSQCALAITDTIVPVLIHGIDGCWPPNKRASRGEGAPHDERLPTCQFAALRGIHPPRFP
jgi:hypothetical protein